jgi:ABC-type transporter Mla MlaB component
MAMSFPRQIGLYLRRQRQEARLGDPEEARGRGLQPAPDPDEIVMVIDGPTACTDVGGLCESIRQQALRSGAEVVLCDVGALVDPDLGTVDALARLQLTARRLGCRIRLRGACGELRELLALSGLDDVVPLCEGLRPQPRGEAEEREPPLGVQEEGDPGDPIA